MKDSFFKRALKKIAESINPLNWFDVTFSDVAPTPPSEQEEARIISEMDKEFKARLTACGEYRERQVEKWNGKQSGRNS